jgi:hypothetical protein
MLLAAVVAVACGGGVFTLEVGTCFNDDGPPGDAAEEISSVPEVDCSEPHDNEVFAVFEYTATDDYPGTAEMTDIATNLCIEQFDEYVGIPYQESILEVFPITPTEDGWNRLNDREIICALYNLDFSKLTGSMEGAAR